MAVTVANDSKNSVTVSNDEKSGSSLTWEDYTDTWDEATGTWNNPNTPMTSESKSAAVTISNDTKN